MPWQASRFRLVAPTLLTYLFPGFFLAPDLLFSFFRFIRQGRRVGGGGRSVVWSVLWRRRPCDLHVYI